MSPATRKSKARSCIVVASSLGAESEEPSAASILQQLGAHVVRVDLWGGEEQALDADVYAQALVVEVLDRPDLAPLALRALQKDPRLAEAPTLLAITERQVSRLDWEHGFGDFIVAPYFPAELYARIRQLEWRASEFVHEGRIKIGALTVDTGRREATIEGKEVALTRREFSLLSFLLTHRGQAFSRDVLLRRVWGGGYEGGPRTVDIHIRRLRAKLGAHLDLVTVRGSGYRVRGPEAEL